MGGTAAVYRVMVALVLGMEKDMVTQTQLGILEDFPASGPTLADVSNNC